MSQDFIERRIAIAAPLDRVWHALTDHREFGTWFQVALDGPFVVGEEVSGHVTYHGFEHLPFRVRVRAMEPMSRFAFSWHPYAVDPERDYSDEPETLVEFTLEEGPEGTVLKLRESGFDKLPPERRRTAFPRNLEGWDVQMANIAAHVTHAA